ncbi:MAG: hypothetical protein AABX71_00460, partial [Nanoarchaeota archaeon]
MERTNLFLIIGFLVLIIIVISFIPFKFIENLSGMAVKNTAYWEDIGLYDCAQAGRWDEEKQDYKLTECPDDRPVMKGIGIAVKDDSQSGGRAYCCKAENLEIYDCAEVLNENRMEDYSVAECPGDKPIMKGIGIKVENDKQGGVKTYCCKAKNTELYSCAITGYWKQSNEDYRINSCPSDRQIISGAGFNIEGDNQAGGKLRCCKGKVKIQEAGEEVKEVAEEQEEVEEKEVEKESFGSIFK